MTLTIKAIAADNNDSTIIEVRSGNKDPKTVMAEWHMSSETAITLALATQTVVQQSDSTLRQQTPYGTARDVCKAIEVLLWYYLDNDGEILPWQAESIRLLKKLPRNKLPHDDSIDISDLEWCWIDHQIHELAVDEVRSKMLASDYSYKIQTRACYEGVMRGFYNHKRVRVGSK